ncbi:MAG: hypothetical protein ABSF18_04610 [Gammaproteobacteria bacterium]|jgi:hypothetical protein
MSLEALHNAFLTYFKTLVPVNEHFTRPLGEPFISRSGLELRYSQNSPNPQEYYFFAPLHNAIVTLYRRVGPVDLSTATPESLLALMEFFNHVSVTTTYPHISLPMRAPMYYANPTSLTMLCDYQDVILNTFNLPPHYFIPVYFIFDANKTLASALNLIPFSNLDAQLLQRIQAENFGFTLQNIQDLDGVPALDEQIVLWNVFLRNAASHPAIFLRMINTLLKEPHVQWQLLGFAIGLGLIYLMPSLDPRYFLAFQLAWQIIGIQLFSPDRRSRMFVSSAFIGLIFASAMREAFVSSIKSNIDPLTSQVCQKFSNEKLFEVCGRMLYGLKSTLLNKELQIGAPALTLFCKWVSKTPRRLIPEITPAEISAVQRQIYRGI